MRLYYHKTDGGAEYLTDKFIRCPDGSKGGVIKGARFIVRIDGDITKDAELSFDSSRVKLVEPPKGVTHWDWVGNGIAMCDMRSTRKRKKQPRVTTELQSGFSNGPITCKKCEHLWGTH